MECIDSSEIQNTDDNCFLNDLSTPLTDSEPESDNEDPDMGISVPRPRMEQSDSCYTVTFTVNIAVGLLKVEDAESLSVSEKKKKGQKKEPSNEVVEAPRAEGYYCIEYNMFPDDPEPTKVDLVMFGLAAKVYMTNETKVLKPWQEGNQVWVGWSQTFRRNVTKELLIKMACHKIAVKVWDSKDKISFRARNDRPKAFRLPQESGEDPNEMVGIKKMVCKLRAIYEKENQRTSMKHHTGPVANKRDFPITHGLDGEKNKAAWKMLFQKLMMEFLDVAQPKEAASLELSLVSLVAGSMTLTDCLEHCSGGVNEGFLNITLDQPLMSKELKAELNPLVITILSALSLPSSPVPFPILKEKCLPVYCRYKFHNMPLYSTKGHDHSPDIYFKDTNVIFTGLLSTGQLCEFLRGPPLEIEVHDRDRKLEKPYRPPAVFDPSNFRLDSVDLGITKCTESKLHDPYGIAKLDLSDLLTGCRYLKTKLPIGCSNCAIDELEKTTSQRSSFEVPLDTPMPMGHYIQADSHLKVQVEIAYPINPGSAKSEDCPFGRIIYIFKCINAPVLAKLTSEILQVNSEAFQLDCYPEETLERVLSGHKMSAKDRENKIRNVLTGFHMMDKARHLFVLEGLQDQAVKRLWTQVPMKLDGDEEEQVTVLYNSDLSFSERLYDTLDVGLSPIYLLKPLETIMGEPLLFIRNMVPCGCLEAIKRISHLCHTKKLSEAVHHNLFPSANMVLSLSKQFGLVLGRGQLKLVMETPKPQDHPDDQNIKKRIHPPLDNVNNEYFHWKQQQGNNVKDIIQANIEDVHRKSIELQKSKPITLVDNVDDGQPGQHSPNVQSMDSAQRNKLLLRDMITICIPFTYPGFKSSVESNQHPKRPDDARIDELRKPWRENSLHGSTLKPTLSRSRLPWIHRHQDFEFYSKPQFVFGTEFPMSIHLAGESLHKEQLEAAHAQYNRWMSKMLLDETAKASGRFPEFICHTKRANLDKLDDILKDEPMKYSLRRPGMILKPIPVTSVVRCTNPADSVEREANIPFAAGPFQNHSLCWDKNTIPRHTSHYSKYHFRGYWRPHSFLHKPGAFPLTDERINSTQKPADAQETHKITTHFKHNKNIIEMRTNKDITLHVH
ncbi:uncharacterized protein cfap92 isoform X1 [Triplophysa dalaica]|uniref:uncharacterized protein cfap92 isoform X1 n=1 Tax=Triplophysa dalaica TaxID=1582913 RepID=UPI0024E00506|nr:uncharacterized protein cfap92 isoform X1 [Triplophysa dalaica]